MECIGEECGNEGCDDVMMWRCQNKGMWGEG
jgi:hypothetical protein